MDSIILFVLAWLIVGLLAGLINYVLLKYIFEPLLRDTKERIDASEIEHTGGHLVAFATTGFVSLLFVGIQIIVHIIIWLITLFQDKTSILKKVILK